MNFFDKFQRGLEKVVGPFATAVANSRYIKALTEGFMYTMPITLGVAAIAVLANLPIPAWTQFLQSIGIYATALEVVSLTLSLLAIYVVGAIGMLLLRMKEKMEQSELLCLWQHLLS